MMFHSMLPMRRRSHSQTSLNPSAFVTSFRSSSVSPSVTVFPSLTAATAALREACDVSGTPSYLLDGALEQIRQAGNVFPSFEVTKVRVYTPPPREEGPDSSFMLLFRGTPEMRVEERLRAAARASELWGRRSSRAIGRLFLSSSLRVALPYGQLAKINDKTRDYRIVLCRVERRPGVKLFNRAVSSEEDLKLLESVDDDMQRFKGGVYDGQVDWLDDGAAYCFNAEDVRLHTLLSIDTRC